MDGLDPYVLEHLHKKGIVATETYTELRRRADLKVTVTPHDDGKHGEDEKDDSGSAMSIAYETNVHKSGEPDDSDDSESYARSRISSSWERSTTEKFKAYLEKNFPNRVNGRLGSEFDDEWVSTVDLFLAVQKMGGYEMLKEQKWTTIAKDLYNGDMPGLAKFGEDLKEHYERYCLNFDDFTPLKDLQRKVGEDADFHKSANTEKPPKDPTEPEDLSEEVVRVHKLLPQVTWDHLNVDEKVARLSMMGPWGGNDTNIRINVTIVFPLKYPWTTSTAKFTVKSSSKLLSGDVMRVHRIASICASHQQGCLEPTLRYLLGDMEFEQAIAFYEGAGRGVPEAQTMEKTPEAQKEPYYGKLIH